MHAGMPSLYAEEPAAVEEGNTPALHSSEPKVHDMLQSFLTSATWLAAKSYHYLLARAVQACGASFHLLFCEYFNVTLLTCKDFKQDVVRQLNSSVNEVGKQG